MKASYIFLDQLFCSKMQKNIFLVLENGEVVLFFNEKISQSETIVYSTESKKDVIQALLDIEKSPKKKRFKSIVEAHEYLNKKITPSLREAINDKKINKKEAF